MTQGLELKLVKKFPKFFRDYKGDPYKTCMSWGIEHGDGWFQLFYNLNVQIAAHIETLELTNKKVPDFYWSQIKEKYGTARWYYSGGDEVIDELVTKAENETEFICEQCGSPGKIRGKGWYYTACEEHAKELDKC